MGDDTLTLTPVYKFTWADGTERRTDDADAFADDPSPDAVENLAMVARDDPECDVELIRMDS